MTNSQIIYIESVNRHDIVNNNYKLNLSDEQISALSGDACIAVIGCMFGRDGSITSLRLFKSKSLAEEYIVHLLREKSPYAHVDVSIEEVQQKTCTKGLQREQGQAMIDSPEIVIRSQKELDKLLDDNYNAIYKVVFIDKDLRLDSSRKTYWKEGKASFKYAIKFKNIDAERLNIDSISKITAHDVEAWNIKCTNIHAHDINCQDLEAKTVWADSIRAEHIYSKNVRVRDSILMNL